MSVCLACTHRYDAAASGDMEWRCRIRDEMTPFGRDAFFLLPSKKSPLSEACEVPDCCERKLEHAVAIGVENVNGLIGGGFESS